MDGIIETWVRRSFEVQAVQVTEANMREVAIWCGGVVRLVQSLTERRQRHIEFDVVQYNKHRMAKARVGDWVVKHKDEDHFSHYRDKSFRLVYRPKDAKKRFEEVLALVKEATLEQDIRSYYAGEGKENPERSPETIALKIVQLFED